MISLLVVSVFKVIINIRCRLLDCVNHGVHIFTMNHYKRVLVIWVANGDVPAFVYKNINSIFGFDQWHDLFPASFGVTDLNSAGGAS